MEPKSSRNRTTALRHKSGCLNPEQPATRCHRRPPDPVKRPARIVNLLLRLKLNDAMMECWGGRGGLFTFQSRSIDLWVLCAAFCQREGEISALLRLCRIDSSVFDGSVRKVVHKYEPGVGGL